MSVASGTVVEGDFDVLKVFTATRFNDREKLGDTVTAYKNDLARKGAKVVATAVMQSSDSEFHCLTITVFSKNKL